MLTGDENIIDINFSVFWRIRNASAYLFDTRHPAATVKAVAESVMREVIGRTPIQPALTEARAQIETEVTKRHAGDPGPLPRGRRDHPGAVAERRSAGSRDRELPRRAARQHGCRAAAQRGETYHNDIVPRARGDAARDHGIGGCRAAGRDRAGDRRGPALRRGARRLSAAKDVTLRRLYIETMQDILAHAPSTVLDGRRLKGNVRAAACRCGARPAPHPARRSPPAIAAAADRRATP